MFVCAYICIYLPEANSMQRKGLEMSFKRRFGHDTLICVYFFEEKKKPLFSYVEQVFYCVLLNRVPKCWFCTKHVLKDFCFWESWIHEKKLIREYFEPQGALCEIS